MPKSLLCIGLAGLAGLATGHLWGQSADPPLTVTGTLVNSPSVSTPSSSARQHARTPEAARGS